MPVEPSDNTRVNLPPRPLPVMMSKELAEQIRRLRMLLAMQLNSALLWDADKVKRYLNMLNFYNNNFWGYGTFGRQTNYDPRTPQGLAAIQSNFNYAKSNVENFATTLATAGATEGVVQAVKWATTPVKIGLGAEAVVSSAPLSTQVTKVTTIPRAEMHARNMVPGALRSRYVKTSNGLTTYTLPKVRILSKEQFAKAGKALEKMMQGTKWKKITHPNMLGAGFTDGNWVVSDIGPGNVGRDWLGRLRLVDFSMEPMPAFRMAMQKQGGKIKKGLKGLSTDRKIDILKHTYRTDHLDSKELVPVTSDVRIETYHKYPQALDSDFNYYINEGNGTYMPITDVEVTAYSPLKLLTYYPAIHPSYDSKLDTYPWTGHSQIVGVCSKDSDDDDYNLVTNNCSDETREYLEEIFLKKLNPFLFTTPGDVRDFALENGGYSRNNGRDIFIPMNKERYTRLRNLQKKKSREKFNNN